MTAACELCGQTCIADDAWTVRGLCAGCRAAAYGAAGACESPPLFVDGPVPLAGQTKMEV